jgi:L-glyceraldehyde 3-phosphate reductase
MLKALGTPCLLHQPKYSLFERWVEDGLLDVLEETGTGCIPYSPLAQGLLSDRYLKGIPKDSRVARGVGFLTESHLSPDKLEKIKQLNELAVERSTTLAQMALAWVLKDPRVSSVLIGASRPEQISDAVECLEKLYFEPEELSAIENILKP